MLQCYCHCWCQVVLEWKVNPDDLDHQDWTGSQVEKENQGYLVAVEIQEAWVHQADLGFQAKVDDLAWMVSNAWIVINIYYNECRKQYSSILVGRKS